MFKRSTLLRWAIPFFWIFFAMGCLPNQPYDKNTLQINIVNNTEFPGFFGVCSAEVKPDGNTRCSIPQSISFGYNRIFVPPFEQLYPFFITLDELSFFCATDKNPNQQLFLTPAALQNYTLTLTSFNLDSDGNRLSVNCSLTRESP